MMAQTESPPPENNLVRPKGYIGQVIRVLNACGAIGIVVLMLLVNADIFGRIFAGSPLPGTVEIVSLSIVAIAFLQMPDSLQSGRIMRSDALLRRIVDARPRTAAWMEFSYDILGALLFAVVVIATVPRLADALNMGEFVGALGHFIAPVWPVKVIVIVGAVVMVIQFVRMAMENWRLARGTRVAGEKNRD